MGEEACRQGRSPAGAARRARRRRRQWKGDWAWREAVAAAGTREGGKARAAGWPEVGDGQGKRWSADGAAGARAGSAMTAGAHTYRGGEGGGGRWRLTTNVGYRQRARGGGRGGVPARWSRGRSGDDDGVRQVGVTVVVLR